jgi:hypothetical protein
MIIIAPVKMPADPKPAIARPAIKIGDVGAAAHMTEPTSKTIMQTRNVLCGRGQQTPGTKSDAGSSAGAHHLTL